MLRLVGVTPDNWRCPLAVAPEQKEFVADRVLLLARAYAYRADRSHAVFLVEGLQLIIAVLLMVLGLIIVVNSLRAYFAAQRGAESQPAKP